MVTNIEARFKVGSGLAVFDDVVINITELRGLRHGDADNIFKGLVVQCCLSFSTNELREIVRQLENQLDRERTYLHFHRNECKAMLNEVKEVILQRERAKSDSAIIPSCYCQYCCPDRGVQARIERSSHSVSIKVTGRKNKESGGEDSIFESVVEYCCRSFSADELRAIVWQIEARQLAQMDPCDIPPRYRKLLGEIKQVLSKRTNELSVHSHCNCPHCCPQENMTIARPLVPNNAPVRTFYGPDQVRSKEELKEGRVYCSVSMKSWTKVRFVVTREPYRQNGRWWIDVMVYESSGNRRTSYSLADHSVVPYEGGEWNACNFIVYAEEPPCMPGYSNCCCHHHHCCGR